MTVGRLRGCVCLWWVGWRQEAWVVDPRLAPEESTHAQLPARMQRLRFGVWNSRAVAQTIGVVVGVVVAVVVGVVVGVVDISGVIGISGVGVVDGVVDISGVGVVAGACQHFNLVMGGVPCKMWTIYSVLPACFCGCFSFFYILFLYCFRKSLYFN